jgi:hypothetical protein
MPIVYDVETYPNVFTCAAVGLNTDDQAVFEISERRDDRHALWQWLYHLHQYRIEMIGFNNLHFDYPVIHLFMNDPLNITVAQLYDKATQIIFGDDRFAHTIWPRDRFIPQIDLFKIHHFDNIARATSLKALQFNMRSESVEDLPIPPGTMLTPDQIPALISYNMHDTTETKAFAHESAAEIQFRRDVTEKYGRDFMNHNDTKIGKDYFIMRLEDAAPGSCYTTRPRRPKQTIRHQIALTDVIFPYIQFEHPEFNRILLWMKQQVITKTKGVFHEIECTINGFTFHFGTGGIHGSVERTHVHQDNDHAVIDLDVTSFYPSIAIANRLHPEHLGELFCDIYADVMEQRLTYKKGTIENSMLKLALNGVYGDSNNPYSPFYDSQYTMSITINGQLLLCMLAEQLMKIPRLEMIQINTDGMTVRVHRDWVEHIEAVKLWWESVTRLQLEQTDYDHMYIRDVNNFVARSVDGKVKRKGAYEHAAPGARAPLGWHQDCGGLIIPKVAEGVLLRAENAEQECYIANDPFDFMLRAKVNRNTTLMHGDTEVQRTTRFYVAIEGEPLVKVSPPPEGCVEGNYKRANGVSVADYNAWHSAWGNVWNPDIHTKNKSVYAARRIGICTGWNVAICNRADAFDWDNVNYDYYIQEIGKLTDVH